MDKRPRKELIDGLRDSLRNFEERYDRSEWEHFQQHRNGKRRKPIPLFVKLAGIAAMIIVMVYASVRVLPLLDRTDDDVKHTTSEVYRPRFDNGKEEHVDSPTVDSLVQPVEEETVDVAVQTGHTVVWEQMPRREAYIVGPRPHRKVITRIETNAPIFRSSENQRPIITGIVRRNIEGSPQRADKSLLNDLPKIGDWTLRWPAFSGIDVGVHITPLFTNKGFSLGGGVSAQLPLTDRLGAEIGVSYLNVKVGQDKEADLADTVSMQLVGVRNSVGLVALPLSLNYEISERFTVSLGLSPFRVVRDQRTDILQRNRWISGNVSSSDSTGGRLVTERTRSQRADSVYMGNTYLGFVQLSGMYTPSILPRRNLVLMPFVAVPMGRLRKEENSWLHGGVSIRFYLR